jgi:transposase
MIEQEADAVYGQGREAVVAWMLKMDRRVRAIENQLNQNSQNSSKPPSSEPPEKKLKPMRLRKKTSKKRGGQTGHEGTSLKQVENPDHIISHLPQICVHCQASLVGLKSESYTF